MYYVMWLQCLPMSVFTQSQVMVNYNNWTQLLKRCTIFINFRAIHINPRKVKLSVFLNTLQVVITLPTCSVCGSVTDSQVKPLLGSLMLFFYLWAVGVDGWLGKEALLGLPPPGGPDTDHPDKQHDEDEEHDSAGDAAGNVREVTLDLCRGKEMVKCG